MEGGLQKSAHKSTDGRFRSTLNQIDFLHVFHTSGSDDEDDAAETTSGATTATEFWAARRATAFKRSNAQDLSASVLSAELERKVHDALLRPAVSWGGGRLSLKLEKLKKIAMELDLADEDTQQLVDGVVVAAVPQGSQAGLELKLVTREAVKLMKRMQRMVVDVEVQEVHKNQRLGGGGSRHTKGDPPTWCTRKGAIAVGTAAMAGGLQKGWIWLSEWSVMKGPSYDEKGWEHAPSFEGPFVSGPTASTNGPHLVRRQLWFRVQVKLSAQEAHQIFHEIGPEPLPFQNSDYFGPEAAPLRKAGADALNCLVDALHLAQLESLEDWRHDEHGHYFVKALLRRRVSNMNDSTVNTAAAAGAPAVVFCEASTKDWVKNNVDASFWGQPTRPIATCHPYTEAFGPPDVPLLFLTRGMKANTAGHFETALLASWIRTHMCMYPNTPKVYMVACIPTIARGFRKHIARLEKMLELEASDQALGPRQGCKRVSIQVADLPFHLCPHDKGVYTLGRNACAAGALFRNPSGRDIASVVDAVVSFQIQTFGAPVVQNVQAIGHVATAVASELKIGLAEAEIKESGGEEQCLAPEPSSSVIIIDRGVDAVALLKTQLTYGGLLEELQGQDTAEDWPRVCVEEGEEVYGCGGAKIPSVIDGVRGRRDDVCCNGWSVEADTVWQHVRDLPLDEAKAVLSRAGREINELHTRVKELKEASMRYSNSDQAERDNILFQLKQLNTRRNQLAPLQYSIEDHLQVSNHLMKAMVESRISSSELLLEHFGEEDVADEEGCEEQDNKGEGMRLSSRSRRSIETTRINRIQLEYIHIRDGSYERQSGRLVMETIMEDALCKVPLQIWLRRACLTSWTSFGLRRNHAMELLHGLQSAGLGAREAENLLLDLTGKGTERHGGEGNTMALLNVRRGDVGTLTQRFLATGGLAKSPFHQAVEALGLLNEKVNIDASAFYSLGRYKTLSARLIELASTTGPRGELCGWMEHRSALNAVTWAPHTIDISHVSQKEGLLQIEVQSLEVKVQDTIGSFWLEGLTAQNHMSLGLRLTAENYSVDAGTVNLRADGKGAKGCPSNSEFEFHVDATDGIVSVEAEVFTMGDVIGGIVAKGRLELGQAARDGKPTMYKVEMETEQGVKIVLHVLASFAPHDRPRDLPNAAQHDRRGKGLKQAAAPSRVPFVVVFVGGCTQVCYLKHAVFCLNELTEVLFAGRDVCCARGVASHRLQVRHPHYRNRQRAWSHRLLPTRR